MFCKIEPTIENKQKYLNHTTALNFQQLHDPISHLHTV